MIFFIFEPEGALGFGKVIDKLFEWGVGQGVEISAVGDVLETDVGFKSLFGINALEQEPFDFKGDVWDETAPVEVCAVRFEGTSDVAGIRIAVDAADETEDHHFSGAKDVTGQPAQTAPVDRQAQIRFALSRKTVDRGTVKRQIVVVFFEKLLVVIEHVKTAFEV